MIEIKPAHFKQEKKTDENTEQQTVQFKITF